MTKSDFEWLGKDAFFLIGEAAKNKIVELNGNSHDCGSVEDVFVQGFYEGINFLRDAIETELNKKERTAGTVRSF